MTLTTKRILKITICLLITVDGWLLGSRAWMYGRAYAAVLTAPGRCTLAEKARSLEESQRLIQQEESFAKSSHVIAHEGDLDLWWTPRGELWVPKGDTILPFILAEQELKIYGDGERGVHPGDVVLDCGANIGLFSRTALAAGASLVVAVEPAPVTLQCLRRNLAAEISQGRVVVYPKGVWDRDDWLMLAVDDHNAGSNSLVLDLKRPRAVRVPLTTIDEMVAELKLKRVDFIKMDIEGAEKPALSGAKSTLAAFHPRMAISPEHLPDDAEAIPALVKNLAPSYLLECGHCIAIQSRVRPQALYFY